MTILAHIRWLVVLLSLFLLSEALAEEKVSRPYDWVNDFAHVISPEYRDKLTALIQGLEEKTSAEIAVATFESIAPYDEKEYARRLFDDWKPGKKGKDNGVLVLLAVRERRWRIETGYGVEGILPDGLVGEIGRNYMVPYFKDGKYGEGLYNGVVAIAGVIAKDAGVDIGIQVRAVKPQQDLFSVIKYLIFAILFPVYFFLPRRRRLLSSGYWYGGIGGGGGFGGFGGGGGGGGGAGGGF